MHRKFAFKVLGLFWLVITALGIVFSQAKNTYLLTDFREETLLSKKTLDQFALEVIAHKQWFKNHEPQLLSFTKGAGEELENLLNGQLDEIWQEIEKLEHLTKGGWLDNLLAQLDSNAFVHASPNEIQSWIDTQSQYIKQIQADMSDLDYRIEQIKQSYIDEKLVLDDDVRETLISVEVSPTSTLEHSYYSKEYNALEASLLFLLGGLEVWGLWLDPNNDIGLLPEAEGRFMTSSTPILQTGTIPGGMGVVGFAGPITISRNGIPQGFTPEQYILEPFYIEYDDTIEDVFAKVPYADRLVYQYGIQIDGRTIEIYRKPIETELTLTSALQKMGAPPEAAEVWVTEYAAIAHFPQTIQLAWLISGNPLAQDYQLHIENVLATFDLNALLSAQSEEFSLPTAPEAEWINQDPFWAELQNQPFLKAFTNLLSSTSEEIQRSFIVTLFFLEPVPQIFQAPTKTTNNNVNLRSKPFFWSEESTTAKTGNSPTEPIVPAGSAIIDPDQNLVAEALKQKKNLIHYWLPGQGSRIIPWSQRSLLNPYEQGAPYFIMGVTALPQFAPQAAQGESNNYNKIVQEISSRHTPQNQPVFKVFAGPNVEDRHIFDNSGKRIYLAGDTFVWRAEKLDSDAIMQHGTKHTSTHKYSYVAAHFDGFTNNEGPYIAGSLAQIKKILAGKQGYTIDMVVTKFRGTAHYGNTKVKMRERFSPSNTPTNTWLSESKQIATDIFSWSPQEQDELLVGSSYRQVVFKKKNDSDTEIQTSSMIKWKTPPSNEALLQESEEWGTNLFLVQVRQGYFIIPAHELEYLQLKADERPQVHTFLPLINSDTEVILRNTKTALARNNLDCESVRMLSRSGMELAYSPDCKIIATESGWELAKASEKTQLAAAKSDNQPIAIFHSENKPPSALPLRFFLDVEQSSMENLQVTTLVPAYDFEGLDTEEQENAIDASITDALRRIINYFPNQQNFKVLMPQVKGLVETLTYTSVVPENFEAKYSYDTITVSKPSNGQKTTFYALREGAVNIESTRGSELELAAKDVMLPSGEFNKDKLLLLARAFHDTNESPYIIVQGNQNKLYGGSLGKLRSSLPESARPANLLLFVTKSAGYSIGSLGWLEAVSQNVSAFSQSLQANKSSNVTALSSNGERQAIFSADGTLQLDELLQWSKRPDNQTLKSMRQAVNRHMLLANIPNKGYFIAQSSDGEFLVKEHQAQIDTLILSFGQVRNLTMLKNRSIDVIQTLPVEYSIRVLGSIDIPSAGSANEPPSFYDDVDIALKFTGKEELLVDLQKSGLELTERTPKQWLVFTERFGSPLAIFQWSDGKRSSILFDHLLDSLQDIATIEAQLIVPAYSSEDLDGNTLDEEEMAESIAITLQDTLQRAFTFLPNQTTFQIVMPDGETRHYSQDPPPKNKIQPEPLGVIGITRQSDNTKIEYYYKP